VDHAWLQPSRNSHVDARSSTNVQGHARTSPPGHWQEAHGIAALHFLGALPDDVPALLDRLVELSLSHRWALAAAKP
jgi:hypothetical protein